jgi:hypothetical protein
VESAPGQGTVVRQRIPFEPAGAGRGAGIGMGAAVAPAPSGARPLHVLLVDDVALNREVLRASS